METFDIIHPTINKRVSEISTNTGTGTGTF